MNALKAWALRVRKKLTAVILAFGAALGIYTMAQQPIYTVTATMPTVYTTSQALPLADIASWTVTWRVDGGAVQTKVVNAPLTATMQTTIPKVVGTTCVISFVTATATALSPNSVGLPTAEVCKTLAGSPGAPTGQTLQ
jgi:hypothetical protein